MNEPTTVVPPSCKATPTKGHCSDQAIFQEIVKYYLIDLFKRVHPSYKATFSWQKGWPHRVGTTIIKFEFKGPRLLSQKVTFIFYHDSWTMTKQMSDRESCYKIWPVITINVRSGFHICTKIFHKFKKSQIIYSQTCLIWPSKGTGKYDHITQV